jgi:hypothetical protein
MSHTDDAGREVAISKAADLVEFFHASGSASNAHAARRLMEDLIRGRSPQMVAFLERQRGLDLPVCANEVCHAASRGVTEK